MSAPATQMQQSKALVVQRPKVNNDAVDVMDSSKFDHMFRIANVLAASALTPHHLRGSTKEETAANCFRVVNQAIRWQFDPFAVADETYVVKGKLGYQGKLIAAVINSRAGIVGRIRAKFFGKGAQLSALIYARFEGDTEDSEVTIDLATSRTDNAMWTKDPEQKLFYSGVIKWARRHCPEIIMGVLSEDDLERFSEANRNNGRDAVEAVREKLANLPAKANGGAAKEEEWPQERVALPEAEQQPIPEPPTVQPDSEQEAINAMSGTISRAAAGNLPALSTQLRERHEAGELTDVEYRTLAQKIEARQLATPTGVAHKRGRQ